MAEFAIRPITPVHFNESNEYLSYPVATGEDFTKGAPVVMSGGEVSEGGADPASILGFATAGVADYSWQEDTFGYVSKRVPVALSDMEFRGTLEGTFAAADVGTEYGLVEDASGFWVVDKTDTTNTRVVITGVDDEAEVGDTNVPVTFRVLDANRQVIG